MFASGKVTAPGSRLHPEAGQLAHRVRCNVKRRMISTGAPCRSGRHGVTLIELLIVIVMIGILSGIAASRLDWQRYRTDAIAREVITEVSKAQRLAVTLQANVRFVVIDPQRIQIHEDVDNNGAVGSGERVRTVVLDEPARLTKGRPPTYPAPPTRPSFPPSFSGATGRLPGAVRSTSPRRCLTHPASVAERSRLSGPPDGPPCTH